MKKTCLVLGLILISTLAYGSDYSLPKQIARLQDERNSLTASYEKKQKELTDITMKIHDIDTQLSQLRQKPRS